MPFLRYLIAFMLMHVRTLDEIIHLFLHESYSFSFSIYCWGGNYLTIEQQELIRASGNSVYWLIFHFNKYESIKNFVSGLGRLDLHHIIALKLISTIICVIEFYVL